MMSIAEFSARTGLQPSTLRFYESKEILMPAERLDNGYRCYAESQILHAKLINSLRQSGVGLSDIRFFLSAEEETRSQLLERWRQEAEARMLSVQIAKQYLNGIHSDIGTLHLTRWEEPVTILWTSLTVSKPINSYMDAITQTAESLQTLKIRTEGTGIVRVIESLKHTIHIEIGFPVASSTLKSLPPGMYIEKFPPTLFVTVDCSWEDTHVCMRTIRFLQRFGFEPTGKRLERHFSNSPIYELMIPVAQSDYRLTFK